MPLPGDAGQFTPWRLTSSYVELVRLDFPVIRFWFICVDPQTRVGSTQINYKLLLGPTFSTNVFQASLPAPSIKTPNPIIQYIDSPKMAWDTIYRADAAENYSVSGTNYNGANGTLGIINTGSRINSVSDPWFGKWRPYGTRQHGNKNR